MTTTRAVRASAETDQRPETDRRIDNVGRLTPGAGIETGSDLMAAEALQEAETEVGTAGKWDRGSGLPDIHDRPTRRSISALRPES